MGIAHAGKHAVGQMSTFPRRQRVRIRGTQARMQGDALDHFHGQIDQITIAVEIENLDNIRVVQRLCVLCFALQGNKCALEPDQVSGYEFDRNKRIRIQCLGLAQVACPEDSTHASATELLDQFEAILDEVACLGQLITVRGASGSSSR